MLRSAVGVVGLGVLTTLVACSAPTEEVASGSNDAIVQKDCASQDSCFVAEAALTGRITEKLATEIDSGWLVKGPIKVRTKFTIDPPKDEPLLKVELPKGALVEASWTAADKGSITLKPRTEEKAQGQMKVRYTLVPTLQADLYGVSVNYDSTQLLEKVVGGEFKYDAKSESPIAPWGFQGAETTVPAPKISESTIFGLPFADLGVGEGTAEGQLAIQAVARPSFKYKTKSIGLDSAAVTAPDGTAKVPVGDYDSVDVITRVEGELTLAGELDVRPVVAVDSVAGVNTYGLVKYSFSVATKSFNGVTPVQFDSASIHIPLPNVKVPQTPFSLGTAQSESKLTKKVTIQNTGELAAVFRVKSSDSKFSVPSSPIKIEPKSKYDLEVAFEPEGSGSASSTITVTSNDPDSPEQTFTVSANGPPEPEAVEEEEPEDDTPVTPRKKKAAPKAAEGCSVGAPGTSASAAAPWAIAFGLGLLARRRRRSAV